MVIFFRTSNKKKPGTLGPLTLKIKISKTWNPGFFHFEFFSKAGTGSYNKSKNCPMPNRHQTGY